MIRIGRQIQCLLYAVFFTLRRLGQQEKFASSPHLLLGFFFRYKINFWIFINLTVSDWLGPSFHCINQLNRRRAKAKAVGDSIVSITVFHVNV